MTSGFTPTILLRQSPVATPDALSLRQGDRVVIPQVLPKNPLQRVQVIQSLIQIPLSIYAVFRLLKGI